MEREVRYLQIHPTKEIKDLYNENVEKLKKEVEEDSRR